MKRSAGVLRLLFVFSVAIVLVGYNVYGVAIKSIGQTVSTETPENYDDDEIFWDTFEDTENNETQNSESTAPQKDNSETASVEASASGNVQGKIITQYISPYKSGLSYNNVYVKNSTSHNIDIKKLLASKLSFKINKGDNPEVLIVHTHTTETFMPQDAAVYTSAFSSRTRDPEKNMVKIGNIIADMLNAAGIKTLHDTTEHDYPKYTGSYSRAAKTVTAYLKKYPSIKIVLDLHRDAVSSGESDKVKLVTEIDGRKAAQVMLVMGSQNANEKRFPNWQENLKLALRLQQMMETKYPTLARPLSLTTGGYNQSLTKGSLLLEFGTDANSLDEVHYSATLVGDSLVSLFNTLKQ